MCDQESGVDLAYDILELDMDDFDAILNEGSDENGFYQLKSKPPSTSLMDEASGQWHSRRTNVRLTKCPVGHKRYCEQSTKGMKEQFYSSTLFCIDQLQIET
ncbi:uncharacterized protein LOC143041507 [Oratosquilla oratoria]|uniref:uncharacterized protein LOC143041507 n=1 Tax=Oratosquilla oratoria TaxID=337810 RepID=UPI003F762A9D